MATVTTPPTESTPYMPCEDEDHTHHLLAWPERGVITIDECERYCRSPFCNKRQKDAAVLRKHVNNHIRRNNLTSVLSVAKGKDGRPQKDKSRKRVIECMPSKQQNLKRRCSRGIQRQSQPLTENSIYSVDNSATVSKIQMGVPVPIATSSSSRLNLTLAINKNTNDSVIGDTIIGTKTPHEAVTKKPAEAQRYISHTSNLQTINNHIPLNEISDARKQVLIPIPEYHDQQPDSPDPLIHTLLDHDVDLQSPLNSTKDQTLGILNNFEQGRCQDNQVELARSFGVLKFDDTPDMGVGSEKKAKLSKLNENDDCLFLPLISATPRHNVINHYKPSPLECRKEPVWRSPYDPLHPNAFSAGCRTSSLSGSVRHEMSTTTDFEIPPSEYMKPESSKSAFSVIHSPGLIERKEWKSSFRGRNWSCNKNRCLKNGTESGGESLILHMYYDHDVSSEMIENGYKCFMPNCKVVRRWSGPAEMLEHYNWDHIYSHDDMDM